MTTSNDDAGPPQPPDWAMGQATDELYGEPSSETVTQRAQEIARASEERTSERHDEYDDPDQGGEA